MSDVTVKQLAKVVGIPEDQLLDQLKEADIEVGSVDASITEEQKMQLHAPHHVMKKKQSYCTSLLYKAWTCSENACCNI